MRNYLFTATLILGALTISTTYGKSRYVTRGVWKLDNYTDEFGDRLPQRYITSDFRGTFSNSATTGSFLLGFIQISKSEGIRLCLMEYGSHVVKGWRSRGSFYVVSVKARGRKFSFLGKLNYGSSKIQLIKPVSKNVSYPSYFISLLKEHRKLKVFVAGEGINSYRFDINAMGFTRMFKRLGMRSTRTLNTSLASTLY